MVKLPSEYTRQMKDLLGEEEYSRYLACFSEPKAGGLRVNTAKISPAAFEKISPFPLRPIPWVPGGYYLAPDVRAAKDPFYFAGLFYLQEASAMTPAAFLPVREGDRVADLCERIAKSLDLSQEDIDLAWLSGMLHDIGRSKTHDITHAIEGVKIAQNYGYDKDVLNIIERHIGAGITESEAEKLGLPVKSYIPQTLEEKIVAHADNLVSGSKEVDIDFVIKKWKRRIDDSDDNIERLLKLDEELIKSFEE